MRLSYIKVQNFRCIEDCSLNIQEFTSFIGSNNSGKSTLLRAIEIFLNQEKPKPEEWRKGYENEPIVIEGHFNDIQDWERDKQGIASLVHNKQIRLRMTALYDKGIQDYEAYVKEETIEGWAEKWNDLNPEIQEIASLLEINGTKWRTKANQERVRQEIRNYHSKKLITFGEERWTSEGISIKPALKQAIPQAVIVPAVKDATDETKTTQKTYFGSLLNRIIVPAIEKSDQFQDVLNSLETLSLQMSGKDGSLTMEKGKPLTLVQDVAAEISKTMSSLVETQATISLDKPDVNKFLGSNATITLDDGTETPIHLQGHGVQRTLVFALIEILAKQNVLNAEDKLQQRATVLLFEEPELYLHPHLMYRLRNALEDIAGRNDWQVIISTHSPFLIDVANDPKSLVIFRRSSPKTAIEMIQLSDDPFKNDNTSSHKEDREALRAALNFHPTVNEAFFAQRVVLVEGDTEIAVLCHSKKLLALAGIDSNKSDNTSIVSCGGKWTIIPIARLLGKFKIPFRIIHDCDRKGKSDEELEQVLSIHPYRANERIKQVANGSKIFVIEDTFEDILWKDKPPLSDKPYRAWRKIDELENLDHFPKLRDFVCFAFEWDYDEV